MITKAKTHWDHDSLGSVSIPNDKYWGAQTQRSTINFQEFDKLVKPKVMV